jgi:hypothetical protein
MLRKLIMLAVTTGIAKKLYDHYRQKQEGAERAPFPTSSRPGQGGARRA